MSSWFPAPRRAPGCPSFSRRNNVPRCGRAPPCVPFTHQWTLGSLPPPGCREWRSATASVQMQGDSGVTVTVRCPPAASPSSSDGARGAVRPASLPPASARSPFFLRRTGSLSPCHTGCPLRALRPGRRALTAAWLSPPPSSLRSSDRSCPGCSALWGLPSGAPEAALRGLPSRAPFLRRRGCPPSA